MSDRPPDFLVIPYSALDNLPFGAYVIDADGTIEYFNPPMLEMAGAKSAEEVIGLNVLELPSYQKAGLTEPFRRGLGGEPFRVESVRYTSYTGEKTTLRHYNGIPVKGEDGRVKKLLCIVEDITEHERRDEQLRIRTKELELLNRATLGRELKMIELKKEIAELKKALGGKKKSKL